MYSNNGQKTDLVGIVVDNNDPLRIHRLRIRVSEWHTEVPDNQLPWFLPEKLDSWGCTAQAGSFGPPLVGSTMWVKLHTGDPHSPIYTGYVQDVNNITPQGKINYPNRVGFETGNGDYFYLDRKTGTVQFTHRTGTQLVIDGATGRVTVHVSEKTVINSVADVEVTCPTLRVAGNLVVNGDVVFNGNSATSGSSMTHNGVNIGSTHRHGGVQAGPATTSTPS